MGSFMHQKVLQSKLFIIAHMNDDLIVDAVFILKKDRPFALGQNVRDGTSQNSGMQQDNSVKFLLLIQNKNGGTVRDKIGNKKIPTNRSSRIRRMPGGNPAIVRAIKAFSL